MSTRVGIVEDQKVQKSRLGLTNFVVAGPQSCDGGINSFLERREVAASNNPPYGIRINAAVLAAKPSKVIPVVNRSMWAIFPRISSRQRSGFSEGNGAFALDGAAQAVLAYRLGDNIDRTAEDVR